MKYLLLLLSLGLGTAAQAQTTPNTGPCTTLSGYVFGNDKPLAGVTVTVQDTRLLAISNSEGYYAITGNTAVHPTIQFSAAGYEPQRVASTACTEPRVEMVLLPGTRIKQRGKRKGFIIKTGTPTPAQ